MGKLRTIFAGTPYFSVPSLKLLAQREEIDLVGVYTQPDRPAGRGKNIRQSEVKKTATYMETVVVQPISLNTEEQLYKFRKLEPEFFVVAAYGLIIPKIFLDVPNYCINVHASLLPNWRGAAPIHRALMNGDQTTGISIMRITEKLDAGPVWNTKECLIAAEDTTNSLSYKLADLGAEALDEAVSNIVRGTVSETEQDDRKATYAKKISKNDLSLIWSKPAQELNRQVRALSPTPGANATFGGSRMKILSTEMTNEDFGNPPGTIDCSKKNILQIATGTTDLRITSLQLPGKKAMSAKDFLNGYRSLL